ncbi:MAG: electron transfer flavoprotein subunit alpha/FixB family protein [Oscillospiraceae bacterium]|nr:electron transfer flavoprotein subunit alpha/FixB family protein [Oscillospiraceae bacterium]
MYKDVYVFCEQRDGVIQNVSFELIGKARELADSLGQKVTAVLVGCGIADKAPLLIARGADRVIIADRPILEQYSNLPYTQVMVKIIRDFCPEAVLFGATSIGRDLAPSVSATVHTGLTADCTGLAIGDVSRIITSAEDKKKADDAIARIGQQVDIEDRSTVAKDKDGKELVITNLAYTYHDQLRMTRPAFGGNIIATICCLQHRPQMATVRPGVMQALETDPSRTGEVMELDIEPTNNVEILETVKSSKTYRDITQSKILVSAGRGMGSPERLDEVCDLAAVLGGDVSGSRAVVDAGWLDKDRQVGQTGKTVRPGLYIACGISGAIQHVAGMENSGYIIAVNKEESAPIFDVADLGVVGDVHTILPKLAELIRRRQAAK